MALPPILVFDFFVIQIRKKSKLQKYKIERREDLTAREKWGRMRTCWFWPSVLILLNRIIMNVALVSLSRIKVPNIVMLFLIGNFRFPFFWMLTLGMKVLDCFANQRVAYLLNWRGAEERIENWIGRGRRYKRREGRIGEERMTYWLLNELWTYLKS